MPTCRRQARTLQSIAGKLCRSIRLYSHTVAVQSLKRSLPTSDSITVFKTTARLLLGSYSRRTCMAINSYKEKLTELHFISPAGSGCRIVEMHQVAQKAVRTSDRRLPPVGLPMQGRYQEPEVQLDTSWTLHRRLQGVEHPDTLQALHHLAVIVHLNGHPHRGIELMQSCVELKRAVLGPAHPLTSVSNLLLGNSQAIGKLFTGLIRPGLCRIVKGSSNLSAIYTPNTTYRPIHHAILAIKEPGNFLTMYFLTSSTNRIPSPRGIGISQNSIGTEAVSNRF